MDTNRRLVLKGLGLGGIAGFAMVNSPRALSSSTLSAETLPRLALVNDGIVGQAFLHGAATAGGPKLHALTIRPDLSDILNLQQLLLSSHPMRIIALLDDATGTLALDAARNAGARVQWLCQHTARGNNAHHHLLHAAGSAWHTLSALQATSAPEWPSKIGHLLALDAFAPPVAPTPNAATHGNFLSLSIELGDLDRG